ncbi:MULTISPECIES: hypothetical protein [Polynucleobacter]|uniref:hypothetical protein n=1 Tax=Polynucleobacter TaxID=44013 RepID=UPI001C0B3408|nr:MULTISPECIES: hypothetical protein [Polynucleobacter]
MKLLSKLNQRGLGLKIIMKGLDMKLGVFLMLCFSTLAYGQYGQSLNPNNSPLNPLNSELNPNNSSLNPLNSPLNPNNSPLNPSSTNGVYDNTGNRIGYEVKAPNWRHQLL